MIKAADIALAAAKLVGGHRETQHGDKLDNHAKIAELWNGWLRIRKDPGKPLNAHDVAMMMALLKAARTQSGSHNPDDAVDMAGYAACAGEIEARLQDIYT